MPSRPVPERSASSTSVRRSGSIPTSCQAAYERSATTSWVGTSPSRVLPIQLQQDRSPPHLLGRV
jgi:hypothetical protein